MTNLTLIATVSTAAITAALAPHVPPATELLTEEFIFEQSARFMFKQGKQSVACGTLRCVYRGPNGLMCPVGYWLTDEEAAATGEQGCVSSLIARGLLPERLIPFKQLLKALQLVHDNVENWKSNNNLDNALRLVAAARGVPDYFLMGLRLPSKSNFDS